MGAKALHTESTKLFYRTILYRTLTLFTAKSAKGAKFLMLFFAFLASFAV